jgi:hypothetical protein
MSRPVLIAWCLVSVSVSLSAIQITLDRRAIEEAIYLGQSRLDAEKNRFHQQYRLPVSRPPVDWIDVITPYHRVVLAAEARARLGDRIFGQREASAALNAAPYPIELLIELTFHPLNAFVNIPTYDVSLLGPPATRIRPRSASRYPRFGPRTESTGPFLPNPNAAPIFGAGQPMLGGTMLVQFGADDLNPSGRYEIAIADAKQELARVVMDLGRLR